jgi:uracil-DNA glycosylase
MISKAGRLTLGNVRVPISEGEPLLWKARTMKTRSPHFNAGHFPVAFVFSVPGARELKEGKPVAGVTGENLAFALEFLQSAKREMFPSIDRYAYRITNASMDPLARSLRSPTSEATPSEIIERANVDRVVRELAGCKVVVLCGRRAQLLSGAAQAVGRTVVDACHTSNQALNGKYKDIGMSPASSSSAERRRTRCKLWAEEVLQSIVRAQAT